MDSTGIHFYNPHGLYRIEIAPPYTIIDNRATQYSEAHTDIKKGGYYLAMVKYIDGESNEAYQQRIQTAINILTIQNATIGE